MRAFVNKDSSLADADLARSRIYKISINSCGDSVQFKHVLTSRPGFFVARMSTRLYYGPCQQLIFLAVMPFCR